MPPKFVKSRRRVTYRLKRGGRRATRRSAPSRRKFKTGAAMTMKKQPMPGQLFSKFHYDAGYQNLDPTTVPKALLFNANSLFDPESTLIGHQPYMFDQLCGADGIYANYRVNAVKLTIKAKVRVASSIESGIITLVGLRSGQSSPASMSQANELPNSKTLIVDSYKWVTLTFYMNQATQAGLSKAQYASDPAFSAGAGANPARTNIIGLYCQAIDLTTELFMDMNINITYYCQLYGLRTLGQS